MILTDLTPDKKHITIQMDLSSARKLLIWLRRIGNLNPFSIQHDFRQSLGGIVDKV